jgi:hypothetical protein
MYDQLPEILAGQQDKAVADDIHIYRKLRNLLEQMTCSQKMAVGLYAWLTDTTEAQLCEQRLALKQQITTDMELDPQTKEWLQTAAVLGTKKAATAEATLEKTLLTS